MRFLVSLLNHSDKVTLHADVDVEMTNDDLLRIFPHVPLRANKRRFKPTVPTNKRAKRKVVQ